MYNVVIGQVSYGNPVCLTKNGRGDCALIDIRELDELRAIKGLFSELEKGEASVSLKSERIEHSPSVQLHLSHPGVTSIYMREMLIYVFTNL